MAPSWLSPKMYISMVRWIISNIKWRRLIRQRAFCRHSLPDFNWTPVTGTLFTYVLTQHLLLRWWLGWKCPCENLNDKLIMALHHITWNRKTVLCSCNDDRFSNCCLENASMSSTSSCYLPLDLHSSLKDFLTVQFTASLSTNILFFASHLCNLRFTFTPSNWRTWISFTCRGLELPVNSLLLAVITFLSFLYGETVRLFTFG